METLTKIISLTGTLLGTLIMISYVVTVVDCARLFLTARGTAEQIEARKDALTATAVFGGAIIIAAMVHFIGIETIWRILPVGCLFGVCVGAAQIMRSGNMFLNACGNAERITEAKDIFWYAVLGTAIIAGCWLLILR